MGMNKLQNIVVIFLLCVVSILLGLNLIKMNSKFSQPGEGSQVHLDPTLKPEDDPYIINQVRNTIIKRSDKIQECYNEFIERKPEKFEGLVKVDWRIQGDGSVSKPELISHEFGDDEFFKCLKDKIKEFDFPPPPGGIEKYVAHKFFFKKQAE